jgi:hypothetical protein
MAVKKESTPPEKNAAALAGWSAAGSPDASTGTTERPGYHADQIRISRVAFARSGASTGYGTRSASPLCAASGSKHATQGFPDVESSAACALGTSNQYSSLATDPVS